MDIEILKPTLWSQFGAAIDMLERCIHACPQETWIETKREPPYWSVALSALFRLDMYLSDSFAAFTPSPPCRDLRFDTSGALPSRVYTKTELADYTASCRDKCVTSLLSLTDESSLARCGFAWLNVATIELHLSTIRHVQHAAGLLEQILREESLPCPPWVGKSTS
jgi:hypothetical protein